MAPSDSHFRDRYGPWALVAGASVGLGAAFSRLLAQRGLNLILVARRPEPLEETARALGKEFGVETRTLALDLGREDVVEQLAARTSDIDVGLLIYNAALSLIGPFLQQDAREQLRILDLNCRGPLLLSHAYGRGMAERGRGGIILMSSLAGNQGSPLIATYAASKAYNTVLGEGLWAELRRDGVDVLSFCAGATRTPTFEDSTPQSTRGFSPPVMEPEAVALEALQALGRKPSAVAGRGNRLAAFLMGRLLPRRLAVRIMSRQMYDMYG